MSAKKYTPQELNQLHRQVEAELKKIPGVVGVGFGVKEKNGELTEDVGFRVYVTEKKDKSDLKPEEIIPDEIEGFKTDVLLVMKSKNQSACEDIDYHEPLIGGITITNFKNTTVGPGPASISVGTLGCLASINSESSRNHIALLSNCHVLTAGGATTADVISQPKRSKNPDGTFKAIPKEDLHPIAQILDPGVKKNIGFHYDGDPVDPEHNYYYVDCATAKLSTCYSTCCNSNCGTQFDEKNTINNLNINGDNTISGIARVQLSDLLPGPYMVYKSGSNTGRTIGQVIDTVASMTTEDGVSAVNVIVIKATTLNCNNEMKFTDHGDSGSVIVNEKREIIGLNFGGDTADTTKSHGCHIHPVINRLNITILTNTPSASTASQHNVLALAPNRSKELSALKSDLLKTPKGKQIYTLIENHRAEVIWLVNHKRPVTLCWHRNHGPAFMALFIKKFNEQEAADGPSAAIVVENMEFPAVQGTTIATLMDKMRAVLYNYGTPALRIAIEKHAGAVIQATEKSNSLQTFLYGINNQLPS